MILKDIVEVSNTSSASACPVCNGAGGDKRKHCYTCNGTGMVQIVTATCELYKPYDNPCSAPLYVDDFDIHSDVEITDEWDDDEQNDRWYIGDLDV